MSAMTLDGVVVVLRTWAESPKNPRADLTHAGYGVMSEGHRGLNSIDAVVGPHDEQTKHQWKLFYEGVGETWLLKGGSVIGTRASVPNGGGTYTASGSGGKFDGRFAVGSASYVELPSDIDTAVGWSVRCWRKESGGSWEHYVVFGTGTNMSAAAVSASVDGAASVQASTLGVQHWLSVASDGDVQFKGVSDAGSNVAVDYSEPEIRPFVVLEGMATGLSGETTAAYGLPRYKLGGEQLGLDGAGSARVTKVRAQLDRSVMMMLGGDLNDDVGLRILQVR